MQKPSVSLGDCPGECAGDWRRDYKGITPQACVHLSLDLSTVQERRGQDADQRASKLGLGRLQLLPADIRP